MLNIHDAKIAAADSELPALSTILDDDAALEFFAKHFPKLQATAACCTYLRYKPRTSCLASFALDTSTGVHTFHLSAYGVCAESKLAKVQNVKQAHGENCLAPILVPELAVVILPFPSDKELPSIEGMTTREGRVRILSRLSPEDDHELLSADWVLLRYKPERRLVVRLDVGNQAKAVLKFHSEKVYAQSLRATKSLGSLARFPTARPLGHSDRHRAVLYRWLPGESLASLITRAQLPAKTIHKVGRLLAQLHSQQTTKLPRRALKEETQKIQRSADDLAIILPSVKDLLNAVSEKCVEQLSQLQPIEVAIHGDCHPQQFLVDESKVAILDLDNAAMGHPAEDLGNFLAHLEREVLLGRVRRSLCEQLSEELTAGYFEESTATAHGNPQAYLAAGLLRLAHEPFRYRQPDWPRQTKNLVERANAIIERNAKQPPPFAKPKQHSAPPIKLSQRIEVIDPFGVSEDSCLVNVSKAIDPKFARRKIAPTIQQAFSDPSLEIRSIRVIRHKPGRRCLIEYSCVSPLANSDVTVLGKIHAKSKHRRSYRQQKSLWDTGFHYESKDGVSVARPIGTISACQMWLQECVPGVSAWDVLLGPTQEAIAAQIATATHKLHQADVRTTRVHSREDELQILEKKLPLVVANAPWLESRIAAVLSASRELAESIPASEPKGIHRDFYPDQIAVTSDRLYVLDHDLYCLGDPALDLGNFCGHLLERSLRLHGHPCTYDEFQRNLCNHYQSFPGSSSQSAIEMYTCLTLVRHIFLSTQFADRRSTTELILEHCEHTLALQSS